jgi:hypothetical protein
MFCIEKQIYYLRIVSFKLASGDHRRLVKGGSNVEYASVLHPIHIYICNIL